MDMVGWLYVDSIMILRSVVIQKPQVKNIRKMFANEASMWVCVWQRQLFLELFVIVCGGTVARR